MNIREISEQNENLILGRHAFFVKNTKGRTVPEQQCSVRTDYQRDRDRIIHSKAFRRLKHKTQVFIIPEGDHYRTRLTHTLEVSQIARTIARALRLNEDLTEAISLGHDLGHTPFGHSGEKALNELFPGGFRHYEQSIRVVDYLEGGKGLNLTYEVRNGIEKHTGKNRADTLEGYVVKFADRIAYINHDIDDAIRANIITNDELPKDCAEILGKRHSERVNTMICDIITHSAGKDDIQMSDEVGKAMMDLRTFMFNHVYLDKRAKSDEEKVKFIIGKLYEYFHKNSDHIIKDGLISGDMTEKYGLSRTICDYIAGMSDDYAVNLFSEIFLPRSWK